MLSHLKLLLLIACVNEGRLLLLEIVDVLLLLIKAVLVKRIINTMIHPASLSNTRLRLSRVCGYIIDIIGRSTVYRKSVFSH